MAFLDLPPEIIALIASFLSNDNHLAQLVKTHPALHQLLNRTLYQQNQRNTTVGKSAPPPIRGYSALHWGVVRHRVATVRRALALGVDPNQRTHFGDSELSVACRLGHADIVRLLLDTHRVNESVAEQGGDGPFHEAARAGHADIIRMLLDYDRRYTSASPGANALIDVNSRDGELSTPLIKAATWGHVDVVALLLTVPGIDPQCSDRGGWTALIAAIDQGNTDVVQVMLASDKVDPSAPSSTGETPLNYARNCYDSEHVVRMLLATGEVESQND